MAWAEIGNWKLENGTQVQWRVARGRSQDGGARRTGAEFKIQDFRFRTRETEAAKNGNWKLENGPNATVLSAMAGVSLPTNHVPS